MCLQCKILARLRLGYFWENVTSFRKKEKILDVHCSSEEGPKCFRKKLFFNTQYVILLQKCQEVKYAVYNLSSAILGRLQKDMGGIAVIPYTQSATQRLDLVSVTDYLCVRDG